MSNENVPIIGKPQGAPLVMNTDMLKASVPDLLSEIERRGVSLPEVTFQLIQTVSLQRNARWKGDGPSYTKLERAAEVAGECGELVNAVKKLRRHELKMRGNYRPGESTEDELRHKIAYEAGDVLVTVANLLNECGIDMWYALQLAFNTKSDEMGFPEKL